ncbi:unnamed protein product [Notodromas monacha]|uniref:bis(5'-adenosyl)-triphosphatase n=1 Tax=Notodromas monacha TaxID=399045 RepID=A0A7R9BLJ0_9CRUS|nr:unnamed protein product [Notodromas monacha]CAG0917429.1 unnamed protein product [Notodromas monacha]
MNSRFLAWVVTRSLVGFSRQLSQYRPRMGKIPVAVTQFCAKADKALNLEICSSLVRQAAAKNAKAVFLPEGFDYIEVSKEESIKKSERLDGNTITAYRKLAKESNVWLFLGGFHQSAPDGKIFNVHVVIDSEGELRATYRKIHLFDVDIPEKNVRLLESSYTVPGKELVPPVTLSDAQIGLAICYDLRFPEMSAKLRMMGADVLTFPSAFTVETGKAHWETLLRSRAIENQCYVIASAQVGKHNAKRASYGHSMVVDPWGRVLVDLGDATEEPQFEIVELDLGLVDSVRRSMPVLQHRVGALYNVTEREYKLPKSDSESFTFGQVTIPGSNVFLLSESSYAFVNKKCVRPGHVLVAPLKSAKRFEDLSDDEIADLFSLVKRVQSVMEEIHSAKSSTVTVQDGPDAGQTIQHFHVHVIPRTPTDFPVNDNIYKELAEHDKKPNVEWRELADMEAECASIRERIFYLKGDNYIGAFKMPNTMNMSLDEIIAAARSNARGQQRGRGGITRERGGMTRGRGGMTRGRGGMTRGRGGMTRGRSGMLRGRGSVKRLQGNVPKPVETNGYYRSDVRRGRGRGRAQGSSRGRRPQLGESFNGESLEFRSRRGIQSPKRGLNRRSLSTLSHKQVSDLQEALATTRAVSVAAHRLAVSSVRKARRLLQQRTQQMNGDTLRAVANPGRRVQPALAGNVVVSVRGEDPVLPVRNKPVIIRSRARTSQPEPITMIVENDTLVGGPVSRQSLSSSSRVASLEAPGLRRHCADLNSVIQEHIATISRSRSSRNNGPKTEVSNTLVRQHAAGTSRRLSDLFASY